MNQRQKVAERVIELNRNCTCGCYFYFNMVMYNYVIWQVTGPTARLYNG